MSRNRRMKMFKVTRDHIVHVTFIVEATSALKARQTPTPWNADRNELQRTVGEATEIYSQPGYEYAIGNSWSTSEYGDLEPSDSGPVSP